MRYPDPAPRQGWGHLQPHLLARTHTPSPEPKPPLTLEHMADPTGSSNWGSFISSWAWPTGSRIQAKALGYVGLMAGVYLAAWVVTEGVCLGLEILPWGMGAA